MAITTGPSFLQLPHSQDADPSTLVRRADDGGIFVGPIVFTGDITLANDRNLFIEDAAGIPRAAAHLSAGDQMFFGPPAGAIPLLFRPGAAEQMRLPTAGGLHIGATFVAPPVGGLRTEGGILVEAGGVDVSGNLIFGADNAFDIGAVAASRPRDLFVARAGTFGGRLQVSVAGVDGIVLEDAAAVDSSRLFLMNNTPTGWVVMNNSGALSFRGASADPGVTSGVERMRLTVTDLQIFLGATVGGNLIFSADNSFDIGASGASRPRDIFVARDLTVGGDLVVAGAGPHAIGGAAITDVQFDLRGPYVGTEGFRVATDLSPPVNKPAFLHRIVGSITQFSSGTHANFDSLLINPPDIFGAGAIITDATTMRITAAPVGATNNFALWVAAGKTRLDGIVAIGGDSARAQLVVTGSVLTDNGAYGFLNSAGGTGTASGAIDTSIYASNRIVGQEINANSDARIKENVTPVQNALDIIKRLRVVGYNKLAKSGPAMGEFGLIGQELTEALPLALRVSPGDIPDGQGGWKEVDDFYQINYQTVFMLAVRAIQEQQEKIEALEAAAGIN